MIFCFAFGFDLVINFPNFPLIRIGAISIKNDFSALTVFYVSEAEI